MDSEILDALLDGTITLKEAQVLRESDQARGMTPEEAAKVVLEAEEGDIDLQDYLNFEDFEEDDYSWQEWDGFQYISYLADCSWDEARAAYRRVAALSHRP